MKNMFKRFALVLSVAAVMFSLAACGSSSGNILPEIVSGNGAYTIEHVNNMQTSYVLWEGENTSGGESIFEIKHEEWESIKSISWAWRIYKGDEYVGFIFSSGGYTVNNKDSSKYSYGINYDSKDSFGDYGFNISIYLMDKNAEYMQNNVSLTTDCGSFSVNFVNDDDIEGLAIKNYNLDLSGVKPKDVTGITFTLTLTD